MFILVYGIPLQNHTISLCLYGIQRGKCLASKLACSSAVADQSHAIFCREAFLPVLEALPMAPFISKFHDDKMGQTSVSYGFLSGALFRFLGLGWLGLVATSVNLDFDVVRSLMSSTSQERMLDPPIAGSGAIWANLERRRDTTSQWSHGSPLKSRCGA